MPHEAGQRKAEEGDCTGATDQIDHIFSILERHLQIIPKIFLMMARK